MFCFLTWGRGRASGKATADGPNPVWPDIQGALLDFLEDILKPLAGKEGGKLKEKMSKQEEACRKGKNPRSANNSCAALVRDGTCHLLSLGSGVLICRNRFKLMNLKMTFQPWYLHYRIVEIKAFQQQGPTVEHRELYLIFCNNL